MKTYYESADQTVVIDYTNYRGERRKRRILPIKNTLRFMEAHQNDGPQFHQHAQWVFDAIDAERGVRRTFSMLNIHSWEKVP